MNTFSPATKAESAKVNANFTDLSTGVGDVDDNRLALLRQEIWNDFAPTGCVWSQTSGLIGAMSAGVAYVSNGTIRSRLVVAAITSKTFTASKDTYVTLSSANAIVYTEVANGATPPANPANSMPIAKIVTSGAAITNITTLTPRNFDELARATVTMGVTDTIAMPNIPNRKYLELYTLSIPSGAITSEIKFNNDSATNYSMRYSDNGAADATAGSRSSIAVDAGGATAVMRSQCDILNIATQEKSVQFTSMLLGTAGAANTGSKRESISKWANTSVVINRIDLSNAGAGDFAVGTELFVRGVN